MQTFKKHCKAVYRNFNLYHQACYAAKLELCKRTQHELQTVVIGHWP